MIRTPGELYRFTGFDVPARGADPAFQLDALQRRVDQECREKTAALARENQLTREIQALRGERDRALRALGDRCADEEVNDPTVLIDLDTPEDVMGVLRQVPRFLSS